MDHGVSVEGNILLEDDEDDESSVSSESSSGGYQQTQQSSGGYSYQPHPDDDEEEVEVFGGSSSVAQKKPQEVKQEPQKAPIVEDIKPPSNPQSEDEFGISYQKRNFPEWFDKNNVPSTVIAQPIVISSENVSESNQQSANQPNSHVETPAEDDEFAVFENPPVFNVSSSAPNSSNAVAKALENMKLQTQNEENINFQKELEEYPQDRSEGISEIVLNNNKLYTNSFNIFTGNKVNINNTTSEEPVVFLDNNTSKNDKEKSSSPKTDANNTTSSSTTGKTTVLQESKKALADFIEVYGQGMGDQEVLLLDLNDDKTEGEKKISLKKNGKENETRATQKIAIDKSITAIAEGDEEDEDDDDDDDDDEVHEVKVRVPGERHGSSQHRINVPVPEKPKAPKNEQEKLEDEWNSIVIDQKPAGQQQHSAPTTKKSSAPLSSHDQTVEIDIAFEDTNHDYQKWTYEQITEYLQSLDLSSHESSIVVSDNSHQQKSIFKSLFSSSATTLNFPNAENLLKFPFLIAQVDYDPFVPQHLNMLRTIYYSLMEASSKDVLTPIDDKWENLGFQGKDPRTDLNRAIKFLSILQIVAFIESNHSLARYLFNISQSAQSVELQRNKQEFRNRSRNEVDYSWPFMCVSIMLSKEALQCLRAGQLNEVCNKRKNIMTVLNLFHHACFAEFGKLLIEDPTKHHAVHLATLREKCAKNPLKILKHYTDNSDLVISSIMSNDYQMKIQQASEAAATAPKATATKRHSNPKNSIEKEDIAAFDKFEEMDDDPNYLMNRETEKELMKSKNAKKFMVSEK